MAEEAIPISSGESEEYDDNEDEEEDEQFDGRSTLTHLSNLVYEIDAPGTFACGGPISVILPGLHITGFGEVSLPLRERDAKEIITLCQRAPFGRGEETIVDTTVRNTWQLSPSEIQILNPDFIQQIDSLVTNTVAVELGLGNDAKVAARLYKLLIYEPGGFFVPHKDTEKEKGMFASLVITLPSHFKGGELVVSHQGLEKTFRPENPSYNTSYVSFYADCKHEIKPVTSGHRLALVYNVISLSKGHLPSPTSNNVTFMAMRYLKRWTRLDNGPSKALFVLHHQYTPAGLSVQVLKNQDRAIAQMLHQAIKGLNFEMYLGLLDYTKSGGAEGYDGDYTLMDDCADEDWNVHSLVNLNGERIKADFSISKSDIYPAGIFNDESPDSESVEEATGNEGASIELRYHRAVIMIWPTDRWIDILCEKGEVVAVQYLVSLISKCVGIEYRDAPEWQTCKRIATTLLRKNPQASMDVSLLDSLNIIGDGQLVANYIASIRHPSVNEFDQFCLLLDQSLAKFGWEILAVPIIQLNEVLSFEVAVNFVLHFASLNNEDLKAQEVLQLLAQDLIKNRITRDRWFSLTPTKVCQMAQVASAVAPALLTDVFIHIYTRFKDVDSEFIPTVKILCQFVPTIVARPEFINLVERCILFLQNRIALAQARSSDWSILPPMTCTCSDCLPVGAFLKSPTQREFRFKAVMASRKHVQSSISREVTKLNLLEFRTDKDSSPQTLVITKVAKESDYIHQSAAKDATTVAELNSLIYSYLEEQERATKRQKIDHSS